MSPSLRGLMGIMCWKPSVKEKNRPGWRSCTISNLRITMHTLASCRNDMGFGIQSGNYTLEFRTPCFEFLRVYDFLWFWRGICSNSVLVMVFCSFIFTDNFWVSLFFVSLVSCWVLDYFGFSSSLLWFLSVPPVFSLRLCQHDINCNDIYQT